MKFETEQKKKELELIKEDGAISRRIQETLKTNGFDGKAEEFAAKGINLVIMGLERCHYAIEC